MNDLDFSILIPAFIAGMLVLLTHIPLGINVLQRGIIFADLAVAQIAGLGVILAGLSGHTRQPFFMQFIAVGSALIGALLLSLIEKHLHDVREASIGLLFVLAASGGIMLLSHDTHSGEHLKDLLVGQILWVGNEQIIVMALLSITILGIWIMFRHKLGSSGFYALFALAVTASVQLVGIYLVFCSLIVPALATIRMQRGRTLAAFATGTLGYASGLLFSSWQDLPAGAAIVWCMAIWGGALMLMVKKRRPA